MTPPKSKKKTSAKNHEKTLLVAKNYPTLEEFDTLKELVQRLVSELAELTQEVERLAAQLD